jgi:hypothetical protein
MMCECYQIGGPWITFDPDCPAHGYEAQREAKEREEREADTSDRLSRLEDQVSKLRTIRNMAEEAADNGDVLGKRIVKVLDA